MGMLRSAAIARRGLGAGLALLCTLPVYRLLASRETGLAGTSTIAVTDAHAQSAWTGGLVVGLCAILAGMLVSDARAARLVQRVRILVEKPSTIVFVAGLALITALLAAGFVLLVLDGRPWHPDAMVQLLHARFVASGRLAGPATDAEFWMIQNSLVTPNGWVSQYPPGHVVLLAAAFAVGAIWLVPVLSLLTVAACTALIAQRLLPDRIAAARLGAVLAAGSVLMLSVGGGYMNHATTAALLCAAVYAALRARDGALGWAVPAGAAAGLAFATRPLTALAIAGPLFLMLWLPSGPVIATRRIVTAIGGAAPFLTGVLAWNAHFFGSPFRFGYAAALGPATGLGFHRDPWGNVYGPLEALGYTSADLTSFGVAYLESPVSIVLVVALLLMFVPRLGAGERVLVAWAVLPAAANALYWHHQPRLLLEAGPAWALLFASAATHAWHAAGRLTPARFAPRAAVAAGFALCGGLAFALAPQRALAYASPDASRADVPPVPDAAVVFVHDAWMARIAMQLAGTGVRLDSVETMLRQNATCALQTLVDARFRGDDDAWRATLEALDLTPRASGFPPLVPISIGNHARVDEDEVLPHACARQIAADAGGVIDIAPLVWQGDLMGDDARAALIVRDLGPARNEALLRRLPGRAPFVLHAPADDRPILVPYAAGMAALWGEKTKGHDMPAEGAP